MEFSEHSFEVDYFYYGSLIEKFFKETRSYCIGCGKELTRAMLNYNNFKRWMLGESIASIDLGIGLGSSFSSLEDISSKKAYFEEVIEFLACKNGIK